MSSGLAPRRRGSLTKYDPDKGLRTIAVAEAAEKHYARAKDATKLLEAIRAKLTAQAQFVDWWDHVAEKDRGAALPRHSRSAKASRAGKNGLPESYVIARWRKKLGPDRFEATYEEACTRYRAILELEQGAHVAHNSGNNEWYTPREYIDAARLVLGEIDLDPASSRDANAVVGARAFYTKHDDGLVQPWRGRIWLNPPYAAPLINQFCDKLAASVRAGDVTAAIVLVNNATETDWFETLGGILSMVCFTANRIRFWSPARDSATPLQGQAVVYVGVRFEAFATAFEPLGLVLAKPVVAELLLERAGEAVAP